MTKHIFIIAGEPSGDALGAKLMAALKRKAEVRFSGVGGERMAEEGLASLFPMKELSLMGFIEILPHIPRLLKRLKQTVAQIIETQPDVVITIDSPGFTKRLAKQLRKRDIHIPLVHYVAPTVWAYKPERAKTCAALFDHLMVILPFEPPYFEEEGLRTSYVGHPVVEEPIAQGDGHKFRTLHEIAESSPVVLMLPGSRRSELKRLLPVYEEVASQLVETMRNLTIVIPSLPHLAEALEAEVAEWPMRVIVVTERAEKYDAYAAAQVALVKSGTATLELAMAGLPMVVAYKTSAISAAIIRRMIRIPYVSLVNIIEDDIIIPEFLQEACTPELLSNALSELIIDQHAANRQTTAFSRVLMQLGQGDAQLPSEKAAEVVLGVVREQDSASRIQS